MQQECDSKERKINIRFNFDCLTSSESIRKAALKQLESIKTLAKKEQNAKTKYVKENAKQALKEKKLLIKKAKIVIKKKTNKTDGNKTSTSKRTRVAKKCSFWN